MLNAFSIYQGRGEGRLIRRRRWQAKLRERREAHRQERAAARAAAKVSLSAFATKLQKRILLVPDSRFCVACQETPCMCEQQSMSIRGGNTLNLLTAASSWQDRERQDVVLCRQRWRRG